MTEEDPITFDRLIGMRILDDAPADAPEGSVVAEIEIEQHHCNPTGAINGAVFASLADNLATACAGRARFEKTGERSFMVVVDLHAVMLSNQQGGRIRAVSTIVRAGRRVTVVRTVVSGDGGKPLAEVTTTHLPT